MTTYSGSVETAAKRFYSELRPSQPWHYSDDPAKSNSAATFEHDLPIIRAAVAKARGEA